MGANRSLLDQAGTTPIADGERAGSRRVACYQLGSHTVLPCDPAVEARIQELASDHNSLTDEVFRSWASDLGADVLGQAVMKVVGPSGFSFTESTAEVHVFDWSRAADVEMMQRFVDAEDDDDLDEAEVAMDELDAQALAVLQLDGTVGAFASARPFYADAGLGDIGIVTGASARRSGAGKAAVSALISRILLPAGVEPLYRCDPGNAGSHRLSDSLGFETALSLTVVELPEV